MNPRFLRTALILTFAVWNILSAKAKETDDAFILHSSVVTHTFDQLQELNTGTCAFESASDNGAIVNWRCGGAVLNVEVPTLEANRCLFFVNIRCEKTKTQTQITGWRVGYFLNWPDHVPYPKVLKKLEFPETSISFTDIETTPFDDRPKTD